MTWGALLAAFLKGLADFLLGLIAQKDAAKAQKDLGAAEAALNTTEIIAEKADAQAKVEAVDRGDAAAVAGRLRREAKAAGGGSPGGKAQG